MSDATAPSNGRDELEAARAFARAGDWAQAGPAFVHAGRLLHEPINAMAGATICASKLVLAGQFAPPPPPLPRATGLLSVVTCSINPAKERRFRASLERSAGGPHELVVINDARSLCEGYARGLARTTGEMVVLCHDDIEFLVHDLHARIAAHLARFALIGVAGTRRLQGAAWVWGGPPVNEGWVVQPGARGGMAACLYGAGGSPVADGQALDGLFMAGRRDALLSLDFDAATFDGFHFYDLDLSYRAYRAGLPVGICGDVLVAHFSEGDFGSTYARYAARFYEKFPELPHGPQHPHPNFVVHEMPDRATVTALFDWLAAWHRAENESR